MKRPMLVVTALMLAVSPGVLSLHAGQGPSATDQCFACHATFSDKPSSLFTHDIHHLKGISCAGCHGGNASSDDAEKAMDKNAGYVGVPHGDEISAMCAKCHSSADAMGRYHSSDPTDQYALLQGSVHGAMATNGKEHIVQCTTCHNAHGIVSVKNPASPVYPLNVVATCAKCHANPTYIRSYNPSLAVDQAEKYRTSVHGMRNAKGDVQVAECANCHGSHGILRAQEVKSSVYPANIPATCGKCHSDREYMKSYGIPTDQQEKFTVSVHGIALLQQHDAGAPACNSCHGNHGATPPGVESISKVCGVCHALNADLFSSSPHKKAFDEKKLPECETCHGNHGIVAATDTMLGVAPEAVCSRCHTQTVNPAGFEVARAMRQMADSLTSEVDSARALVDEAEQRGMEITEAKFKLRDARQASLEARTKVHAFDAAKYREVFARGRSVAGSVTAEAREAVDEYYFRRIGLGLATLIITIVAVSLYLFIRRLERRPGRG